MSAPAPPAPKAASASALGGAAPSGVFVGIVAAIPPVLAAASDPEARAFGAVEARDVIVGLSLARDGSLSLPLSQLLAPLASLVPLGSVELRAAIGLSIPASLASAVLARRIVAAKTGDLGLARAAITFAFGAIAAVLLATAPAQVALVTLAILLATAPPRESGGALQALVRGAAIALAIWAAPRLIPAVAAAVFFAERPRARSSRDALGLAIGAAAALGPAIVVLAARRDAWLSLGRPLGAPAFAAAASVLPEGALLRAGLVTLILAALAFLVPRGSRPEDRATITIAAIAVACGVLLRAPGAFVVASVVVAQLAAASAGALAIAVDRHVARGRRAVVALVPALALGLGARAFEIDLGARRLGLAASAAHDVAALATWGVAPPKPALILEDEEALLRWARERVVHGLRADLTVLPAQALLASAASTMAARTLATVPGATDPIRALLANGTVGPPDLAPLAQRVPVLADLGVARLQGVARHAAVTGGPLLLALERIDPSDRRLRRPGLERRLNALARALEGRPGDDRLRRTLRATATRDARILSQAGDREGALAAVARAGALGAPEARTAAWKARLEAKQSLDAEPKTEDE